MQILHLCFKTWSFWGRKLHYWTTLWSIIMILVCNYLLFQKVAIPLPQRIFLVWPPPLHPFGNSGFDSYFPLKIVAFATPPLSPPWNFQRPSLRLVWIFSRTTQFRFMHWGLCMYGVIIHPVCAESHIGHEQSFSYTFMWYPTL